MKKILLLIIILTNSFIFSQVRFDGVVTDSLGNAIMGANVIAIEKDTKILDGFGISNDAGYYKISLKKIQIIILKFHLLALNKLNLI